MPIKKWLVCIVCSLFWMSSAKGGNNPLMVTDAYMPAVPTVSRTAAVYLKLENNSLSKIILSGVSTTIAKHAMFHQTVESDDLVKMKHLSSLEINPGKSVEFSPGGKHIMLMGLQDQAIPETFMLNLIFENQISQAIKVSVRAPTNQ
jgi:copper(I)-binding protein